MKTTSPTGRAATDRTVDRRAFTLIELIVVMALLVVIAGVVTPRMAGFFKGRKLDDEAYRIVALTQHAQNRAISEGIPMSLCIDTDNQIYGLRESETFALNQETGRVYRVNRALQLDYQDNATLTPTRPEIFFHPDGGIGEGSVTNLWIERPNDERLWIGLTTNRLSFEITRKEKLN